jgi:hypothetical protein
MCNRVSVRCMAAAVLCATLLLTACSGPGSGATTPSAPAATAGQPTTGPVASSPVSVPEKVLARKTVPISYGIGGELDIAVTQLDVVGELLRLGLTFTASLPAGSEDVELGAVLAGDENQSVAPVSPELIDPVNLKAYEAVAGDIPIGNSFPLADGVPATIVFYFAAPQDEIKTFDIVVSSRTPTIVDVPFAP